MFGIRKSLVLLVAAAGLACGQPALTAGEPRAGVQERVGNDRRRPVSPAVKPLREGRLGAVVDLGVEADAELIRRQTCHRRQRRR